jgi:uncharacterized membrane protein YbhN (UPF0104 family)
MTTTAHDVPAGGATSGMRPAWWRWLVGILVVVVIGAAASLLGWDIRGWFSQLWDTITTISAGYVVAAVALLTVQTVATAFAWYSILRFAYPSATRWRDVLACYGVAVALNAILPANLGTAAMLVMFTALVSGATFAGVLGGYAVEKIFFTVAGAFVYLYLFLAVAGSFDIKFAFVHERPVATALFIGGGGLLLYLVARRLWPHVLRWWEQAKEGGAVLTRPTAYFGLVFLPSLVAWLAMLGVNAVLLTAYGIPVSFETLMRVVGGNSLANVTSVTPGGAGVTQVFNVASLNGIATRADATAFSVSSQLLSTAWNISLAIAIMLWAWGWTGGKQFVRDSYDDAKRRQASEREKRGQRRRSRAGDHQGVIG